MSKNPDEYGQNPDNWSEGSGREPQDPGAGHGETGDADGVDHSVPTQPFPQYGQSGSGAYGQQDESGPDSHQSFDGTREAPQGYSPQDPYGYQYGSATNGQYYNENPYTQQGYYGANARGVRQNHRFGTGTLIGGMLLAALLGGGVAAGAGALIDNHSTSASGSTTPKTTIVNNQDSVNAVSAAAQKASPSVATISVSGSSQSGSGSGVVLDDEGHILTNTHVVTLDGTTSNASIQVKLSDGTVKQANVVGTDPTSDLAVIKVDPQGLNLTPASTADSSKLNVGDIAVAIGAPLGLDGTVTDGIVSNLSRTISVASSAAPDESDSGQDDSQQGSSPFQFQFPDKDGGTKNSQSNKTIALNVMQTDAAINPGNSGGALVNSKGEVIGVNVAIASAGQSSGGSGSDSSGNIGVGFSIPINYAKRIGQEIIDNGKASHGYLGASVSSNPASGGTSPDSSFTNGAVVKNVVSGSPAEKAGLKKGDVVTKLNDHAISDAESLTAAVREARANEKVGISYTRGGNTQDGEVTLGDADDSGQ
ncbi:MULTISPECIES: S1C family serine protease [Micrococcaceae]|uniref:S1C family serine protease n=1 Tax=unclassified Kocuria TaxID=2649579 RepID=UPI00101272ED|nr:MULTISPECIES: trypsin-like peptidase domain-containing protein [unclassified Kocuria]